MMFIGRFQLLAKCRFLPAKKLAHILQVTTATATRLSPHQSWPVVRWCVPGRPRCRDSGSGRRRKAAAPCGLSATSGKPDNRRYGSSTLPAARCRSIVSGLSTRAPAHCLPVRNSAHCLQCCRPRLGSSLQIPPLRRPPLTKGGWGGFPPSSAAPPVPCPRRIGCETASHRASMAGAGNLPVGAAAFEMQPECFCNLAHG